MSTESNPPTLIYDGDCKLCVQLAEFVQHRSNGMIRAEPWAAHNGAGDVPPFDSIGLLFGADLLTGVVAWEALIALHPGLKGLNWLAARLGMQTPVATALSGAAKLARRICGGCRLPWYLRRAD